MCSPVHPSTLSTRILPMPPADTRWTSKVPTELVDCAACGGSGRMDGTYYAKGKLCQGCNGAGKQRV